MTFDPSRVSYEDLLKVFWKIHDPTTLDRQGWDIGNSYRSAIFYHSPQQKAAATASKEALTQNKTYRSPIVTEITAASQFWRAEEYHQRYHEKSGGPNCSI